LHPLLYEHGVLLKVPLGSKDGLKKSIKNSLKNPNTTAPVARTMRGIVIFGGDSWTWDFICGSNLFPFSKARKYNLKI